MSLSPCNAVKGNDGRGYNSIQTEKLSASARSRSSSNKVIRSQIVSFAEKPLFVVGPATFHSGALVTI